jgi:phosphonate transport system ATP-binding protein
MLRIEDASVVYQNGVCALDRINLNFEHGRFIGLLGPSGAGKSTLLRCLNGLVRPSRGDVITGNGESIFASRATLRRHRRGTAMIFQQHHLIGRHTALKNVLIGRLAFRTSLRSLVPAGRAERRLALEVLDRVELLDWALSRADELSGGQQQRIGVARALIQKPCTILADEPIASVDPVIAVRILELIDRVCREDKITAIVSLHQVDLARRFADRIIGLSGGRVVFDGPADALDRGAMQRIYAAGSPDLSPVTAARPQAEEEHPHESPSPSLPHGWRDVDRSQPFRVRAG